MKLSGNLNKFSSVLTSVTVGGQLLVHSHYKVCIFFDCEPSKSAFISPQFLSATTIASTRTMFKLYGVPLSQPTRSVLWPMLVKGVPFELVLTVPGMDHPKMGARHENFRSKTKARSITVPLLEDTSRNFNLTESAAILVYLCENPSTNMSDLYAAPGTTEQATINSYLHWHHTNTRTMGQIASTYLVKGRRVESEAEQIQQQVTLHKMCKRLEEGWMSTANHSDLYIATESRPSIADFLCYGEVMQITETGIMQLESSLEDQYPNLAAWMERMKTIPFHDEAHASLHELGKLDMATHDAASSEFQKKLGTATKKGMVAIHMAQQAMNKSEDSKL